ncbi:sodium:alanine symporter family protein [Pelagibius sp.]|uniref:alanine/glycine:cation symporter family protein n=1 Tax=Pelagibius sp. TaxID=1931238 RepID=UPI002619A8D2|nr:alanine/glycine:cation symporter family protein [Pelagibius sp.]
MSALNDVFNMLSGYVWDALVYILVIVGLTITFTSRFVQFRYFGRMFNVLRTAFHHEGGHISSFQALMLSVAGRVGGGNIGGVAVAITLGGPGAVFWMWMIGLMGMATSFFECSLAQLYKTAEPDGSFRGGPAYYVERGLGTNWKWLAGIFSVLLLLTFAFAFTGFQAVTVSTSMEDAFGLNKYITAIVLTVALAAILFGGIQRIAAVTEFIVPIMALGYILIAIVVIVLNIADIPGVIARIVTEAFAPSSAIGGGIGAAIMMGVKRGLFSNEAGLGSAPNVAAVAYVKHPCSQGTVQAFSVFIDTIIICSCTAFIILLSGVYQPGAADVQGVVLTQNSLADHIGGWGEAYVSVALMLFAFSSVLYNYYLGENGIGYFSDKNPLPFTVLKVLTLVWVLYAGTQSFGDILVFSDLSMGLLALVNLTALALLLKPMLRLLKDYDDQIKAGVAHPVFDPEKFSDLRIDKDAWVFDDEVPAGKTQPAE